MTPGNLARVAHFKVQNKADKNRKYAASRLWRAKIALRMLIKRLQLNVEWFNLIAASNVCEN